MIVYWNTSMHLSHSIAIL